MIYRPLDGLIPYARNARTHSDTQVAQIAASIREFGFTNPVLIADDGPVIAGHGRILAARQLGMTEVPTITLAGLTKAQRRAYVIADNKLALNAGWDLDMLKVEFDELKVEGFDLDLTGFGAYELALLEGTEVTPEPEQLYEGMPEFHQDDKSAFRQILVSFQSQEDVDDFGKIVGQKFTNKTKAIWFPLLRQIDMSGVRVVDEP